MTILTHLESTTSYKTTLSDMESALKQTRITLSKKITELNSLSEENKFGFHISLSTKGLIYNRKSSFQFKKISTFLIKRSLSYQYILTLFSSEHTTPLIFCNQHFISSAFFYKLSKKVKKHLHHFKISMDIKKNIFIGEEKNIRYFLLYFFWMTFSETEWPYSQVKKNEIILRFNQINQTLQLDLSDTEREKAYHFMAITHTRIMSHATISAVEKLLDLKINDDEKIAIATISKLLSSFYEPNYSLDSQSIRNEIKYFVTIMNTMLLDYTNHAVKEHTYSILENNPNHYYHTTLALLDFIQINFGHNLKKHRDLTLKLTKIHVHLSLFSELPTIYNLDSMYLYYKQEYPVTIHLLSMFIDSQLLNRFNLENSDQNKTFLITHYILLLSNYLNFYEFNSKVNISLICSLPYLVENEMKNSLNNSLNNKILFSTLDTCDLIITEFPLKNTTHKQIYFDYPLTYKSRELILNKIETLFKLKNEKLITMIMES